MTSFHMLMQNGNQTAMGEKLTRGKLHQTENQSWGFTRSLAPKELLCFLCSLPLVSCAAHSKQERFVASQE